MAMIKCAECGKEISSTAERCPNCGYKTAHGRSMTEAKGLLAYYVISVILLLVGVWLFFANLGDFMECIEASKSKWFTGFTDEGEKVIVKFVMGCCFLVGGIIDMLIIKKKADALNSSRKTATSQYTDDVKTQLGNQQLKTTDWKCTCGRVNRNYVYTCACGLGKYEQTKQETPIKNDRWECESCHATNPPAAAVCTKCGSRREQPVKLVAEDSCFCTQCGTRCRKGAKFCTNCGHELEI